ncbi:hypothetical protein Tco_0931002 [Tanacetum coccineum]
MKHLSLKFGQRVEGHQADTRDCCAQIGKEGEISGNNFEEEIQEVSLVRESMKEKSTDFITPTKASGEGQEEEISPTILEAAKTLSMAKKIDTGLNAEEEINTGKEEINTGIEEVSTGSTKVDG